jgi:MoxR-like ATPase
MQDAQLTYQRLHDNLTRVIRGQSDTIRLLLAAFFTGGHVLLEDFPGTGKTTLAKALARSIGARFQRVQFTPDLLPNDILGISVFNPKSAEFEIHKGPIFTEILLADEINRASPRTQSALLEAMGEAQVSLDGTHFDLPALFFVIATQNPVEFHGTYPLPEAQMDRFALKLSLGYVSVPDEIEIMSASSADDPIGRLEPCVSQDEIVGFRRAANAVTVSDEIKEYIVRLSTATREAPDLSLGASPRASITLFRCAQALAIFDGNDFVTPDHVQTLASPVLGHRFVLDSGARFGGNTAATVVARILTEVPVPR